MTIVPLLLIRTIIYIYAILIDESEKDIEFVKYCHVSAHEESF